MSNLERGQPEAADGRATDQPGELPPGELVPAAVLPEGERRYRELIENTGSIILRMDPVGKITFVNKFAQRFFGFSASELVGRNVVGTIVPAVDLNGTDLAAMILAIGRHPGQFPNNLNENMKRDGERAWIAWTNQPIHGPDGRVVELMCIGNDITPQVKAEQELAKYRARLELLVAERTAELARTHAELDKYFTLSLDLLCIMNRNGAFLRLNPAWEQTLGYTPAELMQTPFLELVHPDDLQDTVAAMGSLAKPRPVMNFVNRYRCRDGSYRWIEWRARPEENLIYAVARDITERRHLEEQIRHAEKMEAVGQLAGGLAHDFNNQLMGIAGYAELLCDQLKDPQLHEDAASILRAATRAAGLTRDLLTFSRRGKSLAIPIEVHQVVEEIIVILEHSIDKRIVIRRNLQASPSTIIGDPSQFQNALLNLALNARDAMPEGGELIFATDSLVTTEHAGEAAGCQLATPGRCLRIRVTDTGCGMNAEVLRHAFEPFFTTKHPGKGTGMGLASVYGTVRNHGGTISVCSEPHQGTEFTICVPLHDDPNPIAVAEAPKSVAEARQARILLVDDEKVVRDLISGMLRAHGHKVIACKDGVDGVATYRQYLHDLDLVILDIVMPRMNGRDAFLAMRELNPELRVLFISGFNIDDEIQTLLDLRTCEFLQKPFGAKELLEKVAIVLP